MGELQKVLTLRISRQQAEDLEMVATIDGKPMSDEIREALMEHVERRRNDPEFQERLRASIARNRSVLDRLADHDQTDEKPADA